MLCKNCNASNPDDAVFCSACGARIDGKRNCPSCGRAIAEDCLYCNYCGARVDGKTICEKCRTPYEGSFCPHCGAPAASGKSRELKGNGEISATARNILFSVRASLMFGAIVIMLIFSFLAGVFLKIQTDTVPVTQTDNVIDILFRRWSDLKQYFASLDTPVYFEAKFALYSIAVLQAAAIGANIVVCLIFTILATVKFYKKIGREEVSLLKYVLPPVVSTFCAVTVMKASVNLGQTISSIDIIQTGLNGTTVAEIVLVAVLIAGALTLDVILNARKYAENVKKLICTVIAVLLGVVAVSVFSGNFISLEGIDISFVSSIGAILYAFGMQETLEESEAMISKLMICEYFMLVLCIAAAAVLLYLLFRYFNGGKSFRKAVSGVAVFAAVIFMAFMIFQIIIASKLPETALYTGKTVTLGAAPIAGFVFMILSLAAVITLLFFETDGGERAQDGRTE